MATWTALTAVYFIAHVSAVVPAVAFQLRFDAALISALELPRTGCGWQDFRRLVRKGTLAAGRDTLTVAGINGLILCVKPSVHVGRVGDEQHFHLVGAAGFRHRSIRLFSTHSGWEDAPSITPPRAEKTLFFLPFSIDLHMVFGAVLNLLLPRLKQEELFERHHHYFSSRDLDDERGSVSIKEQNSALWVHPYISHTLSSAMSHISDISFRFSSNLTLIDQWQFVRGG